jgi:hypothetical protein
LLLNIVAEEKGKTEKACSPFSSAAKDRETGKGSYTYYSSSMEKQNSYRMLQRSALSSVCMLCSAAHLGKEIHQLALQEEFKFLSEENDIARDLANRGGHTSSFILNRCTSSKVSGFLATVPTAQSSKVVFNLPCCQLEIQKRDLSTPWCFLSSPCLVSLLSSAQSIRISWYHQWPGQGLVVPYYTIRMLQIDLNSFGTTVTTIQPPCIWPAI